MSMIGGSAQGSLVGKLVGGLTSATPGARRAPAGAGVRQHPDVPGQPGSLQVFAITDVWDARGVGGEGIISALHQRRGPKLRMPGRALRVCPLPHVPRPSTACNAGSTGPGRERGVWVGKFSNILEKLCSQRGVPVLAIGIPAELAVAERSCRKLVRRGMQWRELARSSPRLELPV